MKYLLLLLFLLTTFSFANSINGKVVSISDGDTFTLLDQNNVQHKIRLAEIDAPENSQPFGKAAKKQLSYFIFNKIVRVDYTELDRYQRIIGKVFIEQLYISEEMIRTGFAWHYKQYSSSEKLAALEYEARKNKIGFWSVPGAVAPWQWRKKY